MEKVVDFVKIITTMVGAYVASALGGWDAVIKLYFALFICDLCLGALKGIKTKTFSSSILFWGFINKFIAVLFIRLAVMVDSALNAPVSCRMIMVVWYCICEGASILENSAVLGVPIPDGLREILIQVKKGFSINITKIVKQIIDNYKIPVIDKEENNSENKQ